MPIPEDELNPHDSELLKLGRQNVAENLAQKGIQIASQLESLWPMAQQTEEGYSIVINPKDGKEVKVSDEHIAFCLKNRKGEPTTLIVMGPPKTPFMLTQGKIFSGMKDYTEAEAQLALFISYVRSINGVSLPEPLIKKYDVDLYTMQLGELGTRAIKECFLLNWPVGSTSFWDEIKKNLPKPSVPTGIQIGSDDGNTEIGSLEDAPLPAISI